VYGWASRALAKRTSSQTPELKRELRKGTQCVVFGPTVQATQHLTLRSTDNLNYANSFSPMWSQRGAPPLPHIFGFVRKKQDRRGIISESCGRQWRTAKPLDQFRLSAMESTTNKRQALEELLQNCISSQSLSVALEGFQPKAELGVDMCILRIQEAFG
jgi:hypothetical protein